MYNCGVDFAGVDISAVHEMPLTKKVRTMSSDLLFYILPREGKIPVKPEEQKVQEISKDAVLRPLNDEEQELHAEEREAREKEQRKKKKKQTTNAKAGQEPDHKGIYKDDKGQTHVDEYA